MPVNTPVEKKPKIEIPDWLEDLGRGVVAAARTLMGDNARTWAKRKLRQVLRKTDIPGIPEEVERALEDELLDALLDRWFDAAPKRRARAESPAPAGASE